MKKHKSLSMSSTKVRLLKNFFSLFILKGFRFIIPIVSFPYLISVLGVEKFGVINFAMSLGVYFGAVIQYGFMVTGTRDIARSKFSHTEIEKVYSEIFFSSIFLSVFSVLIFFVVLFNFDIFYSYKELYFSVIALVVFQKLSPIWLFQGIENMKYVTILNLISNSFYLAMLFFFVKVEEDFWIVPFLQAILSFIVFLLTIFIIRFHLNIKCSWPGYRNVVKVLLKGRHAFISQLAPNLYNNSAIFILGVFFGGVSVGLYASASKVIDALISLGNILSASFLPLISKKIDSFRYFEILMFVVSVFLCSCVFLFSGFVSKFLVESHSSEVSFYMNVLSLGLLGIFLTVSYGNNFLMLIEKEKVFKNIVLFTSVFYFLISLVFIPSYGVFASVLVVTGARLTVGVLSFLSYLKFKGAI